jgi:uncharacterized protein (TIGR02301 family)
MPKALLVALIMGIGIPALPVQAQEEVLRAPDTAQNRLFLADTLGALHYLTVACSGRMDQSWRGRMAEMMQLEALSAYERDDLVAAFNHGYRQEKRYFPRCTPRTVSQINAQKRIKAEQGQFLSTALADPYLH